MIIYPRAFFVSLQSHDARAHVETPQTSNSLIYCEHAFGHRRRADPVRRVFEARHVEHQHAVRRSVIPSNRLCVVRCNQPRNEQARRHTYRVMTSACLPNRTAIIGDHQARRECRARRHAHGVAEVAQPLVPQAAHRRVRCDTRGDSLRSQTMKSPLSNRTTRSPQHCSSATVAHRREQQSRQRCYTSPVARIVTKHPPLVLSLTKQDISSKVTPTVATRFFGTQQLNRTSSSYHLHAPFLIMRTSVHISTGQQ
jgi:hypothetical protein